MMMGGGDHFPCEPVGPCVDDPTFLIFGIFPCAAAPLDPCTSPDSAVACALTCFTCPICEDPDPVPGFDIVIQSAVVTDGVLSVFIDSQATVAGVQGILSCISATTGKRPGPPESKIQPASGASRVKYR